jgi:cation-transporting ATPase E
MASGSEAAKSIAHIVLTDNKFSSMPKVVAEGRQVVNNIQNSSALFLMKTTMTFCTIIFTLIIGAIYPFQPMHLYGIEFFIIGIPAFFLALKKNTQLIKGSFLKNTLYSTLPKGIALSLAVILTYAFAGVLGIKGDNGAITSIAMLAMSYAGVASLFALCYPFNKINLAVALGSLAVTTAFFLAAGKLMEDFITGVNQTTAIYLLCSIILSLAIIISGNVIAGKIKNKKEKNNAAI